MVEVAVAGDDCRLVLRVSEHLGSELRVRDCKTDQFYLARTVRDLDALLTKFPVRGRRA
jgi:hypothetical protein